MRMAIGLKLRGDYKTPHIVMVCGNNGQVQLHSENYANRSNAKRALNRLVAQFGDYANVDVWDETVKP